MCLYTRLSLALSFALSLLSSLSHSLSLGEDQGVPPGEYIEFTVNREHFVYFIYLIP